MSGFNFAQPWWLLGVGFVPLVWWWLRATRPEPRQPLIAHYADPALLPHLLGKTDAGHKTRSLRFHAWAVAWTLGIIALAGPRWDYTEESLFHPLSDVVVLLDISQSMNVADVRPSRLNRARQEVEDLLALSQGLRVGIIAWASVAHVVTPLTEDEETIRRMLPAINTRLVSLPGSRLSTALMQADLLLRGKSEDRQRSILVISDGDLAEPGLFETAKKLNGQGIRIHTLGVGTSQGGQVPTPNGGILLDGRRQPIISPLNEKMLRALARDGGGVYREAEFLERDTQALLKEMIYTASAEEASKEKILIWNERFYPLVALALLILLPWFRKDRVQSTTEPTP